MQWNFIGISSFHNLCCLYRVMSTSVRRHCDLIATLFIRQSGSSPTCHVSACFCFCVNVYSAYVTQ